jgi:hypothetical protein
MAENLNHDIKPWKSWCYDDKDLNCEKYGRLYDWNAANKACPEGWRLPSQGEWSDLVSRVDESTEKAGSGVGVFSNALGVLGAALKVTHSVFTLDVEGMKSNFSDYLNKFINMMPTVGGNTVAGKKLKSKDAKGTDDIKFSALLGGGRDSKAGFYYIGVGGAWWTSTVNSENSNEAFDVFVFSDIDNVRGGNFSKADAYSVRCVKNRK